MDISKVLTIYYPNTTWVMNGNSYDGLVWNDNSTAKPTEQELLNHNDQLILQETISKYANAMTDFIDSKAKERNYDNGISCATYAISNNIKWKNESLAFIAWRDVCWEYAYNILEQVQSGGTDLPSIEDFILNCPSLEWPL